MQVSKKTIINSTILTMLLSSGSASGLNLFKKEKTLYPSTNKSIELRVISPKKDFFEKEIQITNASKTNDIYVYIDCNYKTAPYGGGYDRKTAPKRITANSAASVGYSAFVVSCLKNEEIAIRWTEVQAGQKEPDFKTATWYETQYQTFTEDDSVMVMHTYDNGEYANIKLVNPNKSDKLLPQKQAVLSSEKLLANTITFTKAASNKANPAQTPAAKVAANKN